MTTPSRSDDALFPDDERDLLVVLRLSNRQLGTRAEREAIERLGEHLEAAVLEAGVGEFDGDELGGGECTLFFCGPDENALIAVLRPLLQREPCARGAQFVRLTPDGAGGMVRTVVPV